MAFGIAESQVKTGDWVVTSSGELVEQVSELSLIGSSGSFFNFVRVYEARRLQLRCGLDQPAPKVRSRGYIWSKAIMMAGVSLPKLSILMIMSA
jgi:hypothetical protein